MLKVVRGAATRDVNETVGVFEWQRMKKDRVDDAEDRGVGADAERKCQDGDRGEAGIFAQCAKGEPDVLEKIVEERGDVALIAGGLSDERDVSEFAAGEFGGLLR